MNPFDVPATPATAAVPYPRDRIPKQAVLSAAAFGSDAGCNVPSVLEAGEVKYVTRGNIAIALALIHAGIGAADQVLLPAYHCISMVEPVVWRGAEPVFYRINADTSPDLDDVVQVLTPRARAFLVPHYFGFPQNMQRIRAFCDEHRLILIEDCAHAFFGLHAGRPLGSFGDYAIASAWKFFPVCEGGCLVSSRRSLAGLQLESPGLLFHIKVLLDTLEQACEYRRLRPLNLLLEPLLRAKNAVWKKIKPQPVAKGTDIEGGTADQAFSDFQPPWVRRTSSLAARFIISTASKARIVNNRRANYLKLQAATGDLPGCRPLFAELPAATVPQVFPLLIDEPEQIFPMLKSQGVPIIRFGEFLWPGMPRARCPVSVDLSRRVFQFPCHQELLPEELEWMAGCIRKALLARCYNSATTSGRDAIEC